MGIRIAASIAMALALLGLAAMAPLPLAAQEPPYRTKIDVPRDEIDNILVESTRDRGAAIKDMKAKIEELDKKNEDLLYELINTRAKLKRAVEGLEQLEPSGTGRAGGDSMPSKHDVLRPLPSPRTAKERDEILKKYEDCAKVVSSIQSELDYLIKYTKDIKVEGD